MRKRIMAVLLALLVFLCSVPSYASTKIGSVNINVWCGKQQDITIDDVYVQVNDTHYSCIEKTYRPVSKTVKITLKADAGYYFSLSKMSQIIMTGNAALVSGRKYDSSTILNIIVNIDDGISWLNGNGNWYNDVYGVKYQEEDGTFVIDSWKEINGKYYYFVGNGYLLTNSYTADGYWVNEEGEWDEKSPQIVSGM